jgi:general secretion pathway protein L
MSEYLIIRLGNKPDDPVHWIAADSSGAQLSAPASGTLLDAAADTGYREVIVLVPSAEVLTTCVDIPVRGGAKLQAALPYALEEYLADDIDKLHINASSIIADSYGLARIPGTISMLLAENQVFVNDGGDTELVMEDVSPGDALAAIGALDDDIEHASDDESDRSVLPRHLLVYCEAADEERYQHDWIAMRQELEGVDVKLLADGVMPRLAATVATGAGVNLLQGRYGAKKEYSGLFRPWKYAAMLLLGLVVISTAFKATDYFLLLRQEAALKQMFNTEYRQMLPGAPETEDPARVIDSLRRRVGTVTSVPVFLQSMQQLSRAIQQNQEAQIEAISYRGGVVDIRLTAPNMGILVEIQKAVDQEGQFQATIQSTDQDDDKVSSRMQIQEVGS